jgi:hypothetical protein
VAAGHRDGVGFRGVGVGVGNRKTEPAVLTAKRDRHRSSPELFADLGIRYRLEARGAQDYKYKGHTYHPLIGRAYSWHSNGGSMVHRQRGVTLRFLAEPGDVNFGGKVHGGAVMKWIDQAGTPARPAGPAPTA